MIHLHTPTGRTYCGAPPPDDRVNGWTAYRSDATCPACLGPLATVPQVVSHAVDCICPDCHATRHGLWGVVIPAPAPLRLPR